MSGTRPDIRVLEIIADGDPGGGTTHVLQILRNLGGGCSLGLVTQSDSYLLREARASGVPCFGVEFFRSRLDARVPFKLRCFVRKFEPQVVHVHGGRAGFFYALGTTRVPTVYTVHGYHFLNQRPLVRRIAIQAERLVASSAERVIFVSQNDAELARAYHLLPDLERGIVVHNGISLTEMPQVRPVGGRHIGFLGRLEYPKDPYLFLDVVERLPGYAATIIGDGMLYPKVDNEIRRRSLARIRMLGALRWSEAMEELSKFGVLVVTSRWEAFGIAAIEAMWSGVPVVAVNVGGLGEVIENGKSGLLVDNRSADELAQAVVRLTEDTALRERIVEEGRNRVREMFSEERMLGEISEVYRQVARCG